MKKKILILFVSTFYFLSNAQVKLDDFGLIVLNTYLPDNINIPDEAKKMLETKLNQIASNKGMGGNLANPRFIITASVNVGTKDIIAGPPQMIAQNLDLTLYIGDAVTNTIFSNTTLSLKGVGANENKVFIEIFQSINPNNKMILSFVEEGKNKIIAYYSTQCEFIIKDASAIAKQEKYDEAIYKLSLVPEVCQECYFKCLDVLSGIYQQKIDADCKTKLNIAKTKWAAEPNSTGAENVVELIGTINPMSTCQSEVASLINTIDAKLKADERAIWQFKMQQYNDKISAQKEQNRIDEEKFKMDNEYRENQSIRNFELDKIRVHTYREAAVEYAKNQPKTVTYNNIYWR